MMSETDLVRDIMDYLRLRGIWCIRVHSGRSYGYGMHLAEKGTPDLMGCLPDGRCLVIECKLPDWKPRNAQDRERYQTQCEHCARVTKAGGVGLVARSVEDVKERVG